MEGRRNKKRKKAGKKKEFRVNEKKKSSTGFKMVRLVLLVLLYVKQEGMVGGIRFTFLPLGAILFAVVQPPGQFLRVLLLPPRPLVLQLCCP